MYISDSFANVTNICKNGVNMKPLSFALISQILQYLKWFLIANNTGYNFNLFIVFLQCECDNEKSES